MRNETVFPREKKKRWVKVNPNPDGKNVGDCVIRAISIATGMPWEEVYDRLYAVGRSEHDMMSSNNVWGLMLYRMGFDPFILPDACPECVSVSEFARRFPKGKYIVGTGRHAVAVVNGLYFDTWDSGDVEIPEYFFVVR